MKWISTHHRFGRPEEMGGVVSFLVSDEVTPTCLNRFPPQSGCAVKNSKFKIFPGVLCDRGDDCTGRRDERQAVEFDTRPVITLAKSETRKMVLK